MTQLTFKFHWPHGGKHVILTGTFDDWKETVSMVKEARTVDEFTATVNLDPSKKTLFKFVVDGVWRCTGEHATEQDTYGNVNNWRIPSSEDGFVNATLIKSPITSKTSKGNATIAAKAPVVLTNGVQQRRSKQ